MINFIDGNNNRFFDSNYIKELLNIPRSTLYKLLNNYKYSIIYNNKKLYNEETLFFILKNHIEKNGL